MNNAPTTETAIIELMDTLVSELMALKEDMKDPALSPMSRRYMKIEINKLRGRLDSLSVRLTSLLGM